MKKFIPYIFITAFIGAFLAVSFSVSFSGISLGVNTVEAQQTTDGKVESNVSDDTTGDTPKKGPSWIGNLYAVASGALWGAGSFFTNPIGYVISTIFELVFFVTAKLLALSAILLDTVILFTVTNFKFNIDRIGVINVGYKMILNLTNMVFIFILLYMAIKMILGEGGDVKKLLAKVVIVALFINFSLFMTKAIIDISNIFSLGFLNAMKTEIAIGLNGEPVVEQGSVATAWMSGLRLQTIAYNPNSEIAKLTKGITYYDVSMNFLGGSALNLITAFVFFAVSFLFITRFVALLFYMIFSPVAFLGYIAPELKEHSSRWWKGFQSQVIFAPAFLMMAYLVSEISKSSILLPKDRNDTFYTAIQSSFTSGFGIVLNYAILIALMIGGLITAKAMAAQGSAGMVAYADKARGWMQGVAGRNTIGRAAYLASKSEFVNNLATKSPTFGGFAKARLEGVADRGFEGFGKNSGKGYSATLKESIKKKKEMADSIAKSKTRGVDKLIREEQSSIDERVISQSDLSRRVLESQKKENDLAKEHELYSKLFRSVNDLEKEFDILSDKAGKTRDRGDIDAAASASKKLNDEKRRLLNERVKLSASGVDLNRYEAEMENAKINTSRDEANLEFNVRDTAKIQKGLDNLIEQRKNIRDKMKKEYAKNLPFSSWGTEFAFLDEIMPSYTDATDEIRKVKSEDEKAIMEMIKKLASEEAKKQAKTGP